VLAHTRLADLLKSATPQLRDERDMIRGMPSRRMLLWSSAIFLLPLFAYQAWLWSTALDFLPRPIGVRWIKEFTVEPGFPTWLITRTDGYVLYELDDQTITSLQRSGISYLKEALVPRDGDLAQVRRQYVPWMASPLPARWTQYTPEGRGLFSGLVYGHFSREFEQRFLDAVRAPGSFYTYNGHGDVLLVLPSLRLAVFAWTH
jgi:hypothetical protein